MLFITQAFAGWFMVASGLEQRPSVSHYLLTVHLFLALSLLGLSLWTAFGHRHGFPQKSPLSRASWLGIAAFVVLLIQIAYGGFTAGLKAGLVSNTWPLMFGRLIPADLLNPPSNLLETPHTIMFIHRWWAWAGLIAVPLVYREVKKRNYPGEIAAGLTWLTGLVVLQITLGVLTILSQVNMLLALLHQANAIGLFVMGIFFLHQLRLRDGRMTPQD
jgi:cytochrome c oxidase assembly protein subunit 15